MKAKKIVDGVAESRTSWPFIYQTCMLPWLYQEYIDKNRWKTKAKFVANNKDSIIHVTQCSKPPYMFWAE